MSKENICSECGYYVPCDDRGNCDICTLLNIGHIRRMYLKETYPTEREIVFSVLIPISRLANVLVDALDIRDRFNEIMALYRDR